MLSDKKCIEQRVTNNNTRLWTGLVPAIYVDGQVINQEDGCIQRISIMIIHIRTHIMLKNFQLALVHLFQILEKYVSKFQKKKKFLTANKNYVKWIFEIENFKRLFIFFINKIITQPQFCHVCSIKKKLFSLFFWLER